MCSMRCAICGRTIEGVRVWKDGQIICAECLVQAYRSKLERILDVIIFDCGSEPFDARCRQCGAKMDWWSEVKHETTRYVYFECPKCGKRRVLVRKA